MPTKWHSASNPAPDFMSYWEYLARTRTRTWRKKVADSRGDDLKEVDKWFFRFKRNTQGLGGLVRDFFAGTSRAYKAKYSTLESLDIIEEFQEKLPREFPGRLDNSMAYLSGRLKELVELERACEKYIPEHGGVLVALPQMSSHEQQLAAISSLHQSYFDARMASALGHNLRIEVTGRAKPRVYACHKLKEDAAAMQNHFRHAIHLLGQCKNGRLHCLPVIPDYTDELGARGPIEWDESGFSRWTIPAGSAVRTVADLCSELPQDPETYRLAK